MALAAAAEAILLLAVAFLLPIRLLSAARLLRLSASPSATPTRSAAALLTIAALLTATYVVSDAEYRPDVDVLRTEIDELRLKVVQLESMLEENAKTLKSKANIFEENNKLIEAMERDIQLLMNEEENIKKSQSKAYPESNIKDMEDEVQILQQEVRKINKNAYIRESLVNDAEKRVKSLSSEVKKIEDTIAEQWIQIRQFEQAFVLTKMMTSKVHERSKSSPTAYKWPGKDVVLKASRFHKAIHRQNIPHTDRLNVFFLGGSISKSCFSLPYNQFKISMSSARKFHHKVQIFLQDAMRSNRYSRGLANELITSCLAYIVAISPMWIAWYLYSMLFGSKPQRNDNLS